MPTAPLTLLEDSLNTWPQWRPQLEGKPQILCELEGGLTNRAWLLAAGERRAVLRLNSSHDREFNIDREREFYIHNTVARLGFAPDIWYCDPERTFLVTEFIDGRVWSAKDFEDVVKRQALFELMGQLQSLQWPMPRFDYWLHLCHYQECLESLSVEIPAPLQYARDLHDEAIQAFQMARWEPVLVHHDLEPANIIERDNRLYIVDWEYAGLGYRDMDFPDFPLGGYDHTDIVPIISRLMTDYWLLLRKALLATD